MNTQLYDFAAIGVGPFNLGLACLTHPIKELKGIFLDKKKTFQWHPGMLIEGSTLQIPFLADLVSLADPTNTFSFLNYLKQKGKIYSFYIREDFFVMRKEFNQYCQWAIEQLNTIHFGYEVIAINYSATHQEYHVVVKQVATQEVLTVRAKKIVLGTGTIPYIPKLCSAYPNLCTHTSQYMYKKETIQKKKQITIVGSGQSAAEVFYDLLNDIYVFDYELNWITRSPRFFPMEYSKLTLEMTSPEYVDYFYNLPNETKNDLNQNQKNLHKGINKDLINAIFDLLYTKSVDRKLNVNLCTNATMKEIIPNGKAYDIVFHQHEENKYFKKTSEEVILATGYQYEVPCFIEPIRDRIKWDDQGRYHVDRKYSIDINKNELFVQNAEFHTHGFVTPDLGMAPYRNACIIEQLTGKKYYSVEEKISFQTFGVPSKEEIIYVNAM